MRTYELSRHDAIKEVRLMWMWLRHIDAGHYGIGTRNPIDYPHTQDEDDLRHDAILALKSTHINEEV